MNSITEATRPRTPAGLATDHRLRLGLYLAQTEHLAGWEPSMLLDLARIAEEAGVDDIFLGEHIVLSSNADRDRRPDANVRDYGGDWGQEPTKPWLEITTALAALSGVTTDVRLVANAMIAPLRNPLVSAKALATIDVLSKGRLVVNPVPSWQPDEYAAAGVDFATRGRRLDDVLGAWHALWGESPASYESDSISFADIYAEPTPHQKPGPALWFGGQSMHPRLIQRLARYGSGFCPLFLPMPEDQERLGAAFDAVGRSIEELEMVSAAIPVFTDADRAADIDDSLDQIDLFIAGGVTTFFVGAGQFCQSVDAFPAFCEKVVARFDERR